MGSTFSVDSSSFLPHQHAAGAWKGATASVAALAIDGEGLGRSRVGLTSKLHLAVDGRGLPVALLLTSGLAGDNPQLIPLLDQVRVARSGPGRPRQRPERVLADKVSSTPQPRVAIRARGPPSSARRARPALLRTGSSVSRRAGWRTGRLCHPGMDVLVAGEG
ncbi:transposase [Modestobacter excelsi]|uniref:transposase n=1 Tax=Modestobacter excelsi TaxID=2213161 RepID=UPI001C20E835